MGVTEEKIYYVSLREIYRARRLVPAVAVKSVVNANETHIFGDYETDNYVKAIFRVIGARSTTEAQGAVFQCVINTGSAPGSMWKTENDVSVRRLK